MLAESRQADSGIKLEVNERILDSCNGLMMVSFWNQADLDDLIVIFFYSQICLCHLKCNLDGNRVVKQPRWNKVVLVCEVIFGMSWYLSRMIIFYNQVRLFTGEIGCYSNRQLFSWFKQLVMEFSALALKLVWSMDKYNKCFFLLQAIRVLVEKSKGLQREIVDQGRVSFHCDSMTLCSVSDLGQHWLR